MVGIISTLTLLLSFCKIHRGTDRCDTCFFLLLLIYNYSTSVFILTGDLTDHIPLTVFACRKLNLIKVRYEQTSLYQL